MAAGARRKGKPRSRRDPGRRRCARKCRGPGTVRGGWVRRPAGTPRVHTVQTAGAWPLARAFELVVAAGSGPSPDTRNCTRRCTMPPHTAPSSCGRGRRASQPGPWHPRRRDLRLGGDRRGHAHHRRRGSRGGRGRDRSGERHRFRNHRNRSGRDGSAGLAGLVQLCRRGLVAPGERAAVLFTGARR